LAGYFRPEPGTQKQLKGKIAKRKDGGRVEVSNKRATRSVDIGKKKAPKVRSLYPLARGKEGEAPAYFEYHGHWRIALFAFGTLLARYT
jgi:hypothetical protein